MTRMQEGKGKNSEGQLDIGRLKLSRGVVGRGTESTETPRGEILGPAALAAAAPTGRALMASFWRGQRRSPRVWRTREWSLRPLYC